MLENRVYDFVFSRKDPAFPTHSLLVFDIQGVFSLSHRSPQQNEKSHPHAEVGE